MQYKLMQEIGDGFWSIRSSFRVLFGLIDVGTHMSIARLGNGNFLVIDTVHITPELKSEIDHLTNNGEKIEA